MSLLDRDGGIYYAMVRGFMQDQYAEKYAVLTWLLPRYPNPTHFDPANFILGEWDMKGQVCEQYPLYVISYAASHQEQQNHQHVY